MIPNYLALTYPVQSDLFHLITCKAENGRLWKKRLMNQKVECTERVGEKRDVNLEPVKVERAGLEWKVGVVRETGMIRVRVDER